MEEILNVIRNNLKGNYEEDMEFLNSLYEQENQIIQNANATIEAINIIAEEVKKAQTEEVIEEEENNIEYEERNPQETEIDNMIDEFFKEQEENEEGDSLQKLENIILKIESLTTSENENEIHCSFSNDMEQLLFDKIFAKDKQIIITPYKNDLLYIMYADMLLERKRKNAALDALERAIYWNFLNREAREKKLEILYSKKQIVKYLDNLKTLQSISYTPQDIAHCYNKYAQIFDELKDKKAVYAMYKLSYYYYPVDETMKAILDIEETHPDFKELTDEQLIQHAKDNEVVIGPNPKIIQAHRDITKDFLNEGRLDEAQVLLENDYNLTKEEQIAILYNQLLQVKELRDAQQDALEKEEKPKRTRKKTTKEENTDNKKEEKPKKETAKKKTTKKKEKVEPKA